MAPPVAPPAPVAEPKARWTPALFADLPGWKADDLRDVRIAFSENCKGLRSKPEWISACSRFPFDGTVAKQREFIESEFVPYQLTRADAEDRGLITGYYEPLLKGARTRTARFGVPLYSRPDDLLVVELGDLYPELRGKRVRGRLIDTPQGKRVVPYFDRAQIDVNALTATTSLKPLAWVDDVVEAFFLQIQGSGLIELADGSRMRVGYADQNGHPFRGVGRILVDRGELKLEEASMQGIKGWIARNPDRATALLNENASYVFFREIDAKPAGPLGSLGVPLTAERSIAVDTRFIPLGMPVWLATTWPNALLPLNRLMFAQDTGGAIRGVVRADFYWGTGHKAGEQAGRMRQNAQMWVLWPKGTVPPATP
ncbi:MAG: MltA domain-containing protein [Burkholderiales bacterium]